MLNIVPRLVRNRASANHSFVNENESEAADGRTFILICSRRAESWSKHRKVLSESNAVEHDSYL